MKVKVEVSMIFRDTQTVDVVCKALEPDNISFPKGFSFDMESHGRHLNFKMAAEGDLSTFLSTLDDILESAQLSLNTLEQLEAG